MLPPFLFANKRCVEHISLMCYILCFILNSGKIMETAELRTAITDLMARIEHIRDWL